MVSQSMDFSKKRKAIQFKAYMEFNVACIRRILLEKCRVSYTGPWIGLLLIFKKNLNDSVWCFSEPGN